MNGRMGRLRALKEAARNSRRKFRAVIAGSEAIQGNEQHAFCLDRHGAHPPRDDGAAGQAPCEVY